MIDIFLRGEICRWEQLVLIISQIAEIGDEFCCAAGINAKEHTAVMHTQKNVAALPVRKGAYGIKQGPKQKAPEPESTGSEAFLNPYSLFFSPRPSVPDGSGTK